MRTITTFNDLLLECEKSNKKIYEIAQEIEASLAEISVLDVRKKTLDVVNAMRDAIFEGLESSELSMSKMVGADCQKLQDYYKKNNGLFSSTHKNVLKYALATAEQNARMGKIAACPTAGACGIVPAAIIGVAQRQNVGDEKLIDALLTAGFIGKIVSTKTALAGAVGGCQNECGVAAGMAAGAVVEIIAGSNIQILNAAALAIKNILGLACDPIAGLVEVPCVKRNPFLAIHSITAAEMALAGIESVVPIDEVIDALKQIGALMPPVLKESAQAGLATTITGLKITENLNKIWQNQV